jgi:hypothetical protein
MKEIIIALRVLRPALVILDALYRFLPKGVSENDNAQMAQVFNTLDEYMNILQKSSMALVHHTSKGNQGQKGTMDLGAGAGAIGRAADAHLALREHEVDGVYVVQTRNRTFAMRKDVTSKWEYPCWQLCDEDPTKIAGAPSKRQKRTEAPAELNDAAFAACLNGSVMSRAATVKAIREQLSVTKVDAERLLDDIIERHKIDELTAEDGRRDCGVFLVEVHRGSPRFMASVDHDSETDSSNDDDE